ncbi:MAG: general secretion pathway protein GspC [Deltaproteobacteria bacterium]|nr:general secretion pathway protein GspC [Deltaproteobacteria bacterium]
MLDTYFKRYFWTFHLLAIAVAALILAKTANAFVARWLAPSLAAIASTPGLTTNVRNRPAESETSIPLAALLDRNVFRAAREDLSPVVEQPLDPVDAGATATFDPLSCEPASMPTALLGTIVGRSPETSVAIFQDQAAQATLVARIEDRILEQATIKLIAQREVHVDHNGRCEIFSLDEQKPAPPRIASAPPPPPPPPSGGPADVQFGKGVRQTSATEYEIPRTEVDSVLSNLSAIATQARIVPSFQNGKANGFKLFSIKPNSLYSKIGIQNGDVIQRINGYEMNGPEKAFEVYSKLKDAGSISVDLIRRGKSQSLNYTIR